MKTLARSELVAQPADVTDIPYKQEDLEAIEVKKEKKIFLLNNNASRAVFGNTQFALHEGLEFVIHLGLEMVLH